MADEPSLIDIISQGRWESALFTTYALSLTFFETHILKNALVKTGCHNIWVIADIDGYQQSLTERQSSRVGQEYHLIPVALSNGVFHPKCSYPVLEIEARVEPFENKRGFTLRALAARKPRAIVN